MAEEIKAIKEVDNPAEVLRNENGIFEVMSPYGYVFQVTCRPGKRMDIRKIGEPKSSPPLQGTIWRIRRLHDNVA
jgi:hypothetical protein